MTLKMAELAELAQYALSFRTFAEHDPFQAYLDRSSPQTEEAARNATPAELAPTPDEAWLMLVALQAMTQRLHPSTYEWYLDMQSLLLVVIGENAPMPPLARIIASQQAIHAAERQLRTEVRDAHDAGHSWTAIGQQFGVSRQSAFERFSARRQA